MTEQLVETTLWEGASAEPGIFRDVKILGQKSKNKRVYTEQAMAGAVELYEGKTVYISHAQKGVVHRPALERFGRLENVRFDKTKKQIRGDLVYLETQQQMTSMVKEDLDRKLGFFGLSHVADGEFHRNKEGTQVVTKITKVDTVDLVSDPATATSLREQADAPAPGEPTEPHPADTALADGFVAACTAVLQDAALDTAAKVAKIKELLEKQEAAMKPSDTPAEPAKEQADPAYAKLAEQFAQLQAQFAAMKPKKYVTAAPAPATPLVEQTVTVLDAPPKDKAALRKWLSK